MLISLILKYFFYNKRRTFRAVGILAVGITIILGTNMLIGGFINEIDEFSSIVQRANKTFVIYARVLFYSYQQSAYLHIS